MVTSKAILSAVYLEVEVKDDETFADERDRRKRKKDRRGNKRKG